MIKKGFINVLFVSVLILLVPSVLVSATDTQINIKTLPNHKASIFVYPSGELTFEKSYHLTSDTFGNLKITHSSDSSEIDILVKITKDGEKVLSEKFDSYDVNLPIGIRIDYNEINGNYAGDFVQSGMPHQFFGNIVDGDGNSVPDDFLFIAKINGDDVAKSLIWKMILMKGDLRIF